MGAAGVGEAGAEGAPYVAVRGAEGEAVGDEVVEGVPAAPRARAGVPVVVGEWVGDALPAEEGVVMGSVGVGSSVVAAEAEGEAVGRAEGRGVREAGALAVAMRVALPPPPDAVARAVPEGRRGEGEGGAEKLLEAVEDVDALALPEPRVEGEAEGEPPPPPPRAGVREACVEPDGLTLPVALVADEGEGGGEREWEGEEVGEREAAALTAGEGEAQPLGEGVPLPALATAAPPVRDASVEEEALAVLEREALGEPEALPQPLAPPLGEPVPEGAPLGVAPAGGEGVEAPPVPEPLREGVPLPRPLALREAEPELQPLTVPEREAWAVRVGKVVPVPPPHATAAPGLPEPDRVAVAQGLRVGGSEAEGLGEPVDEPEAQTVGVGAAPDGDNDGVLEEDGEREALELLEGDLEAAVEGDSLGVSLPEPDALGDPEGVPERAPENEVDFVGEVEADAAPEAVLQLEGRLEALRAPEGLLEGVPVAASPEKVGKSAVLLPDMATVALPMPLAVPPSSCSPLGEPVGEARGEPVGLSVPDAVTLPEELREGESEGGREREGEGEGGGVLVFVTLTRGEREAQPLGVGVVLPAPPPTVREGSAEGEAQAVLEREAVEEPEALAQALPPPLGEPVPEGAPLLGVAAGEGVAEPPEPRPLAEVEGDREPERLRSGEPEPLPQGEPEREAVALRVSQLVLVPPRAKLAVPVPQTVAGGLAEPEPLGEGVEEPLAEVQGEPEALGAARVGLRSKEPEPTGERENEALPPVALGEAAREGEAVGERGGEPEAEGLCDGVREASGEPEHEGDGEGEGEALTLPLPFEVAEARRPLGEGETDSEGVGEPETLA